MSKKKKNIYKKSNNKLPITPESISELVNVSSPQMSPNGQSVIFTKKYIQNNKKHSEIWLASIQNKELKQLTKGPKDHTPQWSPKGSHIAFITEESSGKNQIALLNPDTNEQELLTNLPEGSIGKTLWSPTGESIAIQFRSKRKELTVKEKEKRKEKNLSEPPKVITNPWYRLDGDGYFLNERYKLYLINIETGHHKLIWNKDTMGLFDFDFSKDGNKIALTTNTHKDAFLKSWKTEIRMLDLCSGKSEKINDIPEGPKSCPKFSPDGKWIAWAGRKGSEGSYSVKNLELWTYPLTGSNRKAKCISDKEDYCMMAVAISDTSEASFKPTFCWDKNSKGIIAQIGWHGEAQIMRFDISNGNLHRLTQGKHVLDLGNFDSKGQLLSMIKSTTTCPPEIAIGRRKGMKFEIQNITDLNKSWCKKYSLTDSETYWVKSTDNTKVQCWILRPKNYKKSKSPGVLQIHGGPHGQYGVGFFHEMQLLASNGFTVFMSNPRGSKGYGQNFCSAIKGKWGTKDWEDISSIADFMEKDKHVKKSAHAIMGGSYGGYMTNWAIGLTNRFSAAITDRCVSNLVSMGGSSDWLEPEDEYFQGNFWSKPESRWEQSPIRHLGNAKTPTLIIHSEGDLRCNVEQAEQVHAILTLKKVPVRFIRYPSSTSHGMSRQGPTDLRIHRLQEIISWLNQWLKKKTK